jgi:hypothetical protein
MGGGGMRWFTVSLKTLLCAFISPWVAAVATVMALRQVGGTLFPGVPQAALVLGGFAVYLLAAGGAHRVLYKGFSVRRGIAALWNGGMLTAALWAALILAGAPAVLVQYCLLFLLLQMVICLLLFFLNDRIAGLYALPLVICIILLLIVTVATSPYSQYAF